MYCQKCGSKIEENAQFCSNCGNPINENIPATNEQSEKTKKLGSAFIISGIIDLIISAAGAILINTMTVNGLASYYNYDHARLVNLVFACGKIYIGLVVLGFILFILGIIFSIAKKPKVNKKTKIVVTLLTTLGLVIINIILFIPYIILQLQY